MSKQHNNRKRNEWLATATVVLIGVAFVVILLLNRSCEDSVTEARNAEIEKTIRQIDQAQDSARAAQKKAGKTKRPQKSKTKKEPRKPKVKAQGPRDYLLTPDQESAGK